MITWIASYPRSGNTFLRVLLQRNFGIDSFSVYGDQRSIQEHAGTRTLVGHRQFDEGFKEEECRQRAATLFIKTHEPWSELFAADRAIYVLRDGRDCLTSYWHFYRDYWGKNKPMMDLIDGKCFAGRWSQHVAGWMPGERENVLLLHFDELVSAPSNAVKKIAAFICMQPRDATVPTFGELHAMNDRFFRQGRTTRDVDAMPPEERARFWKVHGDTMRKYGYAE